MCSAVQCQSATYFSFYTLEKTILRSLYFIIYQEEVKIKELSNHKPTRKGMCMCFLPPLYLIMVVIIIIIIGCVSNGKKKKNREGLEIRTF